VLVRNQEVGCKSPPKSDGRSCHRGAGSTFAPDTPRIRDFFFEIVRQQWNFSPTAATREVEDYRLTFSKAKMLELTIMPRDSGNNTTASLMQRALPNITQAIDSAFRRCKSKRPTGTKANASPQIAHGLTLGLPLSGRILKHSWHAFAKLARSLCARPEQP
jgi:hypothetical protein